MPARINYYLAGKFFEVITIMPTVWIPSLAQRTTGAPERVDVPQGTLRQIIRNLEELHPGLWNELMDQDEDRIKPEIAVAIDGETNHLGLIQRVEETSEVHFIPAIGGGN